VGGSIVTQIISAVMVAASAYAGYIMMQAYQSATPEVFFTQFLWCSWSCSRQPVSVTAPPSAPSV